MQMEEWDAFDVNRVTQLTQGRPLEAVALEVLHRFNLLEKLRLPKQKLRSFLRVSSPALSWACYTAAWTDEAGARQSSWGVTLPPWHSCLTSAAADAISADAVLGHLTRTGDLQRPMQVGVVLCRRSRRHTGGAIRTTTARMPRMWCRASPACLRRTASWRS